MRSSVLLLTASLAASPAQPKVRPFRVLPSKVPAARYNWDPKDVYLGGVRILEGMPLPQAPHPFSLDGQPYLAVFTGGACGSPCYFERCNIFNRATGKKVAEFTNAQMEQVPWSSVHALGLDSDAAEAMSNEGGAWLIRTRTLDYSRGSVHDPFTGRTLKMDLVRAEGFFPADEAWGSVLSMKKEP